MKERFQATGQRSSYSRGAVILCISLVIQNKRSFVLPFSEVCVALSEFHRMATFEKGVNITIVSFIRVMKK